MAERETEAAHSLEYRVCHDWPATESQARSILAQLAALVELRGEAKEPQVIAAVETVYGASGTELFVATVVMDFPGLGVIECVRHSGPITFPYVPGLLYFREGPVIVETMAKVRTRPDLALVHGQGIAHPQHCGLASCLGIVFDVSVVGCARTLLIGEHLQVGPARGEAELVTMGSRPVGWVYRSRAGVRPIYVSPGHKCDLEQARGLIGKCIRSYRWPEPLRSARQAARKWDRREGEGGLYSTTTGHAVL